MTDVCREFGISRKTGYRSSAATRRRAAPPFPIDRDGPSAMPTSSRPRSRASSSASSAISHIGEPRKLRELLVRRLPRRSAHPRAKHHPRRARPPRPGRPHRPPQRPRPGHTLVSRTPAQRSLVRRFQGRVQARKHPPLLPAHRDRPRVALLLLCEALDSVREEGAFAAFQQLFRQRGACPTPSDLTTAFPSQAPTRCSTSPSSPSGGFASASPSNASSRAIRSRTDATSACTSPSRGRRHAGRQA